MVKIFFLDYAKSSRKWALRKPWTFTAVLLECLIVKIPIDSVVTNLKNTLKSVVWISQFSIWDKTREKLWLRDEVILEGECLGSRFGGAPHRNAVCVVGTALSFAPVPTPSGCPFSQRSTPLFSSLPSQRKVFWGSWPNWIFVSMREELAERLNLLHAASAMLLAMIIDERNFPCESPSLRKYWFD